jgi:hypothetical protein
MTMILSSLILKSLGLYLKYNYPFSSLKSYKVQLWYRILILQRVKLPWMVYWIIRLLSPRYIVASLIQDMELG